MKLVEDKSFNCNSHQIGQVTIIKSRSRLNDSNLANLMRIAIEGLELLHVDFNEILDVFKEKKHRIKL